MAQQITYSLSSSEVSHDWEGDALEPGTSLLLGVSSSHITFGLQFAKPLSGLGASSSFTRELWKGDVVELFLRSGRSYVELNLSPTGAWWAAHFSSYRVMERELPELAPTIDRIATDRILLTFQRDRLPEKVSGIAQTGIIYLPDGPRYFVRGFCEKGSAPAREVVGCEPDFHLASLAFDEGMETGE
jgi:hypothetical protein